ncbi:hypothetical protein NUSPORA_01182 [Nucleospora cyclopteri]
MVNSQVNDDTSKNTGTDSKPIFKFTTDDGKELQIKDVSDSDESEKTSQTAVEEIFQQNSTALQAKRPKTMSELERKYLTGEECEFITNRGQKERDESEEMKYSEMQKFLLIEKLCENFCVFGLKDVKNTICQILAEKERKKVAINFIGKKKEKQLRDKIREMQEKESPALEKAKMEFNKVTLDTVKTVAAELSKIKLPNMAEMMELSSFVFTKVIEEKCFLATYTNLIKILKNDFIYEKEEALNKEQTCFFGMLLKLMAKQIKREHSFNKDVEVKTEGKSDAVVEAEIENLELLRKMKRTHSLGALDFCISLYNNQVTGATNLRDFTQFLLQQNSSEHLEMLCRILSDAGNNLYRNNSELVNNIFRYVESNNCYGPRMEIIVEGSLSQFNKKKKPEASRNMFNALKPEEEKIVTKEKTEKEKVDEFFTVHLVPEISSLYLQDLDEAVSTVKTGIEQFSPHIFWLQYFFYSITDKNSQKFIYLFLEFLFPEDLCSNLYGALDALKQELFSLYVDFPMSQRKYPELLCQLRAHKAISRDEFQKLKVSDFERKVTYLIETWIKENYEGIENVYTKEEIEKYFKGE